jgi:hypothetical protein
VAVTERQSQAPDPLPKKQLRITVGVHGDDGASQHVANDADAAPLTVVDVGTFHEFGVGPFAVTTFAHDGSASVHEHPGIPQRSFIRAWFDENQDFIRETLRSQMLLVVAGKLTAEKAKDRIALVFEGSMKQRIARGIAPPLAASTIRRKGSSKPLIDKGQLRAAVRGRGALE